MFLDDWGRRLRGDERKVALAMKHVPTIVAVVVLIAMLAWLYFYAPCGVFYWNNAKDVPARCHAELGRG